jgi:hypothetical protein
MGVEDHAMARRNHEPSVPPVSARPMGVAVLRTNPPGAAGLLLSAVSASHVKQPSRAGPPPPATAVGAVGAGNHRIRGARANSPLSPSPPFLQSLSAPQPVPLPRSPPGSPPSNSPARPPAILTSFSTGRNTQAGA